MISVDFTQALVLLFFLLLDKGVKAFWTVVGFPVLHSLCLDCVDATWV